MYFMHWKFSGPGQSLIWPIDMFNWAACIVLQVESVANDLKQSRPKSETPAEYFS